MIELSANIGAALSFDFVNGFHDVPNATAALVGTRTLNRRQAVAWATLWTFVPLFVVNTGVAVTVGTGLVEGHSLTSPVIFSGLMGAVGWGVATWRKGVPSSSTYALLGGLAGAAIFNSVQKHGFSAFFNPLVSEGWKSTLGWMIATPAVSFVITKGLTWAPGVGRFVQRSFTNVAPRLSRYIAVAFHITGAASSRALAPIGPAFKAPGEAINSQAVRAWERLDIGLSQLENASAFIRKRLANAAYWPLLLTPAHAKTHTIEIPYDSGIAKGSLTSSRLFIGTAQQWWQLGAAAALSFAHAGNDAMKTAGIITAALRDAGVIHAFTVSFAVVALSYTTMTLGTSFGGRRIEETLNNGLGEMQPADGIRSQFVAAVGVMAATLWHKPISTTLVLTAATAGTHKKTNWKVAKDIMYRWGLTIPASAAMGAAMMAFMTLTGAANNDRAVATGNDKSAPLAPFIGKLVQKDALSLQLNHRRPAAEARLSRKDPMQHQPLPIPFDRPQYQMPVILRRAEV